MIDIVNEKDIKKLVRVDKVIARIHNEYGPPPNWSRPQGFVSLSRIILEQQVSLASAHAHFIKLSSYLEEFIPSAILKLTDEEMRNCQVSRQKSKYLRALSNAILEKNIRLENMHTLTEPAIRKQLTTIKGIGNWTTDIYLMFCLQHRDIFPQGDIAVMNTVRELYKPETPGDIIQLSEKWKPLRSLATYFMWHYYLKKRGK